MSLRLFFLALVQACVLTTLFVSLLVITSAEVRTSPSYVLESDSINFGGGLSSSTNYTLESTAGEIATGESTSTSYALKAGYQQMQSVFLSITTPADVIMTPSIGGITGGTANGSTSVTVLTDSPAGYELTIQAAGSPAMQKGVDSIADYVPASVGVPDYAFTTGATEAFFGFSPEGSDIVVDFKDNGASCGIGSGDTALACWLGLSTVPRVIAEGGANQPDGEITTLRFRVELGGSIVKPEGEYVATTTLTALPL